MPDKIGAIFLDRDGVINQNRVDHVKNWDEFVFMPGALESIRVLTETGLPIFIVTNQAIVNRGLLSADGLHDIHQQMVAEIERNGGRIAGVYHCPHDHDECCDCRKPEPGMLLKAALEHDLDLKRSYLVGDAWTDVAAAAAVNAQGILVLTGRGRWNFVPSWNRLGLNFSAAVDLEDAVVMIKESLRGNPMPATARLRGAFHMALHPETSLVL